MQIRVGIVSCMKFLIIIWDMINNSTIFLYLLACLFSGLFWTVTWNLGIYLSCLMQLSILIYNILVIWRVLDRLLYLGISCFRMLLSLQNYLFNRKIFGWILLLSWIVIRNLRLLRGMIYFIIKIWLFIVIFIYFLIQFILIFIFWAWII